MRQKSIALPLAMTALFGLTQLPVLAQQESRDYYRAPSSFAGKTVVLPIGTTFEGRIQSTIGSRQSHSGDSFSVEVSAPVLANGTEVLIPAGAEVIGEVAEAVSSSAQPHDRNQYPLMGILRVQITSLKLPDGMSYPLVASFAPDGGRGRGRGSLAPRKSGVAYVGTQAGFDAVNPALQPRNNNSRSSQGRMTVLPRSAILSDPVLGDVGGQSNSSGQVRALTRKGRDLRILRGSSITIRLDAPLKIALGASNAEHSMESSTPDAPAKGSGGKHFANSRPARNRASAQQSQQSPQNEGNTETEAQGQAPQTGGNPRPQGQATPVEQPGSSF